MKKTIIKIVATLVGTILLAATGYASLVLYPHMLFDHDTSIGNIGVLSEEPIDAEFHQAVEEAIALISLSELYDSNMSMGIVLAHDHIYHRITPNKVLAYAIGPYAILAGETNGGKNELSWDKSPVRMNLVTTMAHELTHCLQGKHHGYFTLNRAMMPWKREGYAEYVAHGQARLNPDYSLSECVSRLLSEDKIEPVQGWITTEDGFDRAIQYYRFRLMTEYLFDVERLSYDEFIENAEFFAVYDRMLAWHKMQFMDSQ